jgi:Ca2+-binding RTX toxin-like protein
LDDVDQPTDSFGTNSSYNLVMGTSGNDTLNVSTGIDYINGGAGVDWASYSTATTGVTVGLGVSTASADYLVNIENIIGSAFQRYVDRGRMEITYWTAALAMTHWWVALATIRMLLTASAMW